MIFWRRWVVAGLFLPLYTALTFAIGTLAFYIIFDPGEGWQLFLDALFAPIQTMRQEEWWWYVGIPVVLLVISQAVFLVPYFQPRSLSKGGGWSMKVSITAAALVAAVLTAALAFAVVGLIDLLRSNVHPESQLTARLLLLFVLLPASWITWTIVLLLFTRSHRGPGPPRRLLGLLVGGTIGEFLLFLPLDAMVRKQTDCYCETKAFFAMCLSVWSLLWLTGPGIVLLLTRRYRHRLWTTTNCPKCGYEKGPTPGAACPECGKPW